MGGELIYQWTTNGLSWIFDGFQCLKGLVQVVWSDPVFDILGEHPKTVVQHQRVPGNNSDGGC